ncbi:hypothetical protein PILCRDRAFT_727570 [Piloderma croceum F 1598]|uniref:Uncharacterized protein n=1 Tax=Piloderma croceum (strain F 1598) TaxID=765440 RepID=A0A0C3B7Z7_PILCF|nr:hypothetical protein PILCRDRAFT_727570 [Piloderma croceum F 1598]
MSMEHRPATVQDNQKRRRGCIYARQSMHMDLFYFGKEWMDGIEIRYILCFRGW